MGVGAAVVRADWLALDSMWVAPTARTYKFMFPILVYFQIFFLYVLAVTYDAV
jgi:hypothetical protein